MANSNDNGILSKIIKFIKNIFEKNDVKYIAEGKSGESNNNKTENSFYNSIKVEEDKEKEMLLKIQDELEKIGITRENVYELTKNLTAKQKKRLGELYMEQIKDYETSINNYKNKIVNTKEELAKDNQTELSI